MNHIRRSIIVLVVYLSILYNVERLDLAKDNVINIQSFVYVLGIATIVAILTISTLHRASLQVLLSAGVGLYLLAKLILGGEGTLWGGIYTYLSVTEITLYLLAIVFAYDVARGLHEFEEAVLNITFASASRRVQKLDQAADDIQQELTRSRRHHRPLTVMVAKFDPQSINIDLHRHVREIQQTMIAHYAHIGLARLIGQQARRIDLVTDQHEQGRFIILSPESSVAGVSALAERIRATAKQQLGIEVTCGLASFPQDAPTFEELVVVAEENSQVQTVSAVPEISYLERSVLT
jgi:GGDEF domain-containing protein